MTVAVGKHIADFTADSTAGPVALSSFQGRTLVLYFYPKDNTPGCTNQGADFRDNHEAFSAAGAAVLGASRDSLKSHDNFKAKLGLPFELLSDPEGTLCALFEVIRMKSMYGKQVRGIERSTFVIDGQGTLLREWRGVKVPGHVDEVLEYVRSL